MHAEKLIQRDKPQIYHLLDKDCENVMLQDTPILFHLVMIMNVLIKTGERENRGTLDNCQAEA